MAIAGRRSRGHALEDDFNRVEQAFALSRKVGVGLSLHRCDSDGAYFYYISSTAPSESWSGKSQSLQLATSAVIERLRTSPCTEET